MGYSLIGFINLIFNFVEYDKLLLRINSLAVNESVGDIKLIIERLADVQAIQSEEDIFLSPSFAMLNRNKVDDIQKFWFFKTSCLGKVIRLGSIIFGAQDDMLSSPFSAPYGGLNLVSKVSYSTIEEISTLLIRYLSANKKICRIVFPAPVTSDIFVLNNQMFMQSLVSKGFNSVYADINYHIDLNKINLCNNVARQHRKGVAKGYKFEAGTFDINRLSEIYDVIADNHRRLGYEMTMTLQDYVEMRHIVEMLLFAVREGVDVIAGAICYVTRQGVLQLISWGDRIEHRQMGSSIAFLASEIIFWVKKNVKTIGVIDLGPASKCGQTNKGLADFKLSLNGIPTIKNTIEFVPSS